MPEPGEDAVATAELRFVEREKPAGPVDPGFAPGAARTVRILQQKWAIHPKEPGNVLRYPPLRTEWRDVPCVQEGDDEDGS